MVTTMVERHITITFPDNLPNPTYAAVIRGFQGVLHAAGLSPRSTIHPDPHITDSELNCYYGLAAQFDPWAP
jgi:hypothetical protein